MNCNPWFVRQPCKSPKFRLYCFPYAGGSGTSPSFSSWYSDLDPRVEVCVIQYPGRGARFGERQFSDLHSLVAELAKAMQRETKLPFAFFGHSLGGLVAFELARYLERNNFVKPEHLFASGCDAPQYRGTSDNLHNLDDEALLNVLRDYDGTPPEVLQHKELMELMLPTIRADFKLVENYHYRRGYVLDIPLTVMAGKMEHFDSLDQVNGWSLETKKQCQVFWLEGDHFFIHSDQRSVLQLLDNTLRSLDVF